MDRDNHCSQGKRINFDDFHFRNAADSQDTWIGLYQDTGNHADHRWVDGTTPFVFNDPAYYQPWLQNDPNERGAGAVRLRPTSYLFADRGLSYKFWAICEKNVGEYEITVDQDVGKGATTPC